MPAKTAISQAEAAISNSLTSNKDSNILASNISYDLNTKLDLFDTKTPNENLELNKNKIQEILQKFNLNQGTVIANDVNKTIEVHAKDSGGKEYIFIIDLKPLNPVMETSAHLEFPKLSGREMQDDEVEFQFTLRDITTNTDISKAFYISTVDDHGDDGGVNAI